MANKQIDPITAARIEQFRREMEQQLSTTGYGSLTGLGAMLNQRKMAYARYDNFILAPIPEDYPVAVKGKLILREKEDTDAAPFVTVICDVTEAFNRNDIRRARQNVLNNTGTFDHVALSDTEWQDLIHRESKNRRDLPLPYYHEALQDFTIRWDDGTIIPFCRSSLPRIYYNDYDIIPLVDSIINCDDNYKMLFGLGLINVEADLYQVAIYWFGNVDANYHDNVVRILDGYFYAQWAFHTCPERIIEVNPGDPNPFGDEEPARTEPKKPRKDSSRKPSKASIGRKIYIREFPSDKKRAIERRCRCWYVHGFMRTLKTGKRVWIKGHFKGPDRNDPAARQHTKDYVVD